MALLSDKKFDFVFRRLYLGYIRRGGFYRRGAVCLARTNSKSTWFQRYPTWIWTRSVNRPACLTIYREDGRVDFHGIIIYMDQIAQGRWIALFIRRYWRRACIGSI